jgi:hypothetical protein
MCELIGCEGLSQVDWVGQVDDYHYDGLFLNSTCTTTCFFNFILQVNRAMEKEME